MASGTRRPDLNRYRNETVQRVDDESAVDVGTYPGSTALDL